jgi:hypothetical protein
MSATQHIKVKITLRLTVSHSICLGVEPTLRLVTRYCFLSECCCLKFAILFLWGALSDERTGLQFAVQSLSGPSHAELVAILYWLISDSRKFTSTWTSLVRANGGLWGILKYLVGIWTLACRRPLSSVGRGHFHLLKTFPKWGRSS